jgi:hypothetical protein
VEGGSHEANADSPHHLLLTCSIAWAEGPAPDGGLAADPGAGGGTCLLPDLAGLSPDQIAAAALGAGFETASIDVQVPICPTTFSCTSITNCGVGAPCTVTNIGQCCQPPTGPPSICCINGIKVRRCPCVCVGSPCAALCGTSTDVSFGC